MTHGETWVLQIRFDEEDQLVLLSLAGPRQTSLTVRPGENDTWIISQNEQYLLTATSLAEAWRVIGTHIYRKEDATT